MSDDLIETIAKAIHGPETWDDLCRLAAIEHQISVMAKDDAFRAARAALSAIEKSGTHLVVETRLADDPVAIGDVPTIIPIPRPIVKVLRREAKDARSGDMVVSGVDIDMAELLEEAADEIVRLRWELSARPPLPEGEKA